MRYSGCRITRRIDDNGRKKLIDPANGNTDGQALMGCASIMFGALAVGGAAGALARTI